MRLDCAGQRSVQRSSGVKLRDPDLSRHATRCYQASNDTFSSYRMEQHWNNCTQLGLVPITSNLHAIIWLIVSVIIKFSVQALTDRMTADQQKAVFGQLDPEILKQIVRKSSIHNWKAGRQIFLNQQKRTILWEYKDLKRYYKQS